MIDPVKLERLNYRHKQAQVLLLWIAILVLAGLILTRIQPMLTFVLNILSPFLMALITTYIFNPVVVFAQKRFRLGRAGAILCTYLFILGIVGAFFAILLPILYGQLREGLQALKASLPQAGAKLNAWLHSRLSDEEIRKLLDYIAQLLGQDGSQDPSLDKARGGMAQAVSTGRFVTNYLGNIVGMFFGFVGFVVLVMVITFYFLLDYHNMSYVVRVLLPQDQENRVFRIWKKIDHALGGFLRGQLIICSLIAIMYTVSLLGLGMKNYAILIGFLAGFGNLVPYLGPILGGAPSIAWVLFSDHFDTSQEKAIGIIIILVLSMVIQTLDGFFFQPRIVGKSAELHPLVIMLALLVGAQFGLGGLIIAVPGAIICRVLLKELWWDELVLKEEAEKEAEARNSAQL